LIDEIGLLVLVYCHMVHTISFSLDGAEKLRLRTLNNSSSLSLWNSFRYTKSFSLFFRKMFAIAGGLLGFATKT